MPALKPRRAAQRPTPQEPYLWGFAKAAKLIGIPPKMLDAAIAAGDMPGVQILRLGARGRRFVIATRVLDWLDSKGAPRNAADGKPA